MSTQEAEDEFGTSHQNENSNATENEDDGRLEDDDESTGEGPNATLADLDCEYAEEDMEVEAGAFMMQADEKAKDKENDKDDSRQSPERASKANGTEDDSEQSSKFDALKKALEV